MEFTKSDITFLPLREEISANIQATTEIVADIAEESQAAVYIEQLNTELRESKLIGELVQVHSSCIIWAAARIDNEAASFEPVPDPELLKKQAVGGVFMGMTSMDIDGRRTLMYHVSVELNDETMTYLSVVAPVDESTILVAAEGGSYEANMSQTIADNLRKLDTIENPKLKELLRDFVDILEEADEMDATRIQELGIVAAWLLAQDDVKNDKGMRKAIGKIVKAVIDENENYRIIGQSLIPHVGGDINRAIVKVVDVRSRVVGIGLIEDYDTNRQGEVEWNDTMQLALIIKDGSNERQYIPLRFITEFSPAVGEMCQTSIQRFLASNPDFIRKMHEEDDI